MRHLRRGRKPILRAVLKPTDFVTVSGDLLEEYRETVQPTRGQSGADVWYIAQVLGFATRVPRVWGAVLGVAVVARTALDWLVPTTDFASRSLVSTDIGIGILLVTGFWSAWRSGSPLAGTLAGITTALVGAVISIAGAIGMLALWHDPQTMSAIRASGGLSEAFTLPIMMVLPGAILGTLGGAMGAAASRKLRPA